MAMTTATAILVGSLVAAAGAVGGSMYSAQAEKTAQGKALAHQDDLTKQAEEKAKSAEALAEQNAKDTLRKRRLSQTQKILTGPVGAMGKASTMSYLLGGGE
jgi:uncharacterized protein HemX